MARAHSRLATCSQRHTVSDGNVAFERGGGVAHSFNCTPAFVVRLADALVFCCFVSRDDCVLKFSFIILIYNELPARLANNWLLW